MEIEGNNEAESGPLKTLAAMTTSPALVADDWVANGLVDFRGRTANKTTTGGWKASPFIIGTQEANLQTLPPVCLCACL